VGHRAGLGAMEKRKILPFRELNPDSPARRYINTTIPAHCTNREYNIQKQSTMPLLDTWPNVGTGCLVILLFCLSFLVGSLSYSRKTSGELLKIYDILSNLLFIDYLTIRRGTLSSGLSKAQLHKEIINRKSQVNALMLLR
jgi:hypothetical protein